MPRTPSLMDSETLPEAALVPRVRTRLQRTPEVHWTDAGGVHCLALSGPPKTLGSAGTVDIVVRDPGVSRLHAELELRPDGVWVKDLGSRNGTYLRDLKIHSARWPDEAPLRVGGTLLSLNTPSQPTAVPLWPQTRFGRLLGRSDAMRELFGVLHRVATAADAAVLIQGETGTGKELVAQAIHDSSPRAEKPFIVIDCAALTESLVESELFGHVAGAFTGAHKTRLGALEQAEGGTVFLDEVGELPLSLQPKLLRVIETRTLRPLGDAREHAVDVRFLSATHRDLRTLVNAGTFREDLYFRLAGLPIVVPPLRERRADIAMLVRHFVPDGTDVPFTDAELEELSGRSWLGNVRELRNHVERVLTLGTAAAGSAAGRGGAPAVPGGSGDLTRILELPFKDAREAWNSLLERTYVQKLLADHGRSVSTAAQSAGVDRTYLYRLIQKHGL